MKRLILIVALVCPALTALTGCSDSANTGQSSTNASTAVNPVNAPAEYLGNVGSAKQRAVNTVNVASITQAIQMFYVSEDRYPADLKELVTKGYLRELPEAPHGQKIVYNPADGTVTVAAE